MPDVFTKAKRERVRQWFRAVVPILRPPGDAYESRQHQYHGVFPRLGGDEFQSAILPGSGTVAEDVSKSRFENSSETPRGGTRPTDTHESERVPALVNSPWFPCRSRLVHS